MNSSVRLFVTDVAGQPAGQPLGVRVDRDGTATHLRGLPIMRVGTWNGTEYDADRLRQIATNFGRILEAEAVGPALKSRHTYGPDGAENVDVASVTRGRFEGVYFDEVSEVLFGDVAVLDPALVEDMVSGRVRYVSAEVVPTYRLAGDEADIGPALVGAAFVDWPAVKGLPWNIVLNRAEFSGADNDGPKVIRSHTTAKMRGGLRMPNLIDLLKGLFKGEGDPEALEQFRDVLPGVTTEPPPEQADEAKDVEADTPVEVQTLQAQVAQLTAAQTKALADVQRLQAENRTAKVDALMTGLVTGGHVAPAQQAAVRGVVEVLMEGGQSVTLPGDGDSEPVTRDAVMVYVDLLRAATPAKGLTGPGGRANPTGEGEEPGPERFSDEKLDALVKLVK